MSFARRQVGDVLVLEVAGDLTLRPETNPLREEMYSVMLQAGYRKVLLNLAGLHNTDTTTVGLLMAAKTSAINRDVQLKVCCVPPPLAQLLQRLQLTKILDVYEQEALALENLR